MKYSPSKGASVQEKVHVNISFNVVNLIILNEKEDPLTPFLLIYPIYLPVILASENKI